MDRNEYKNRGGGEREVRGRVDWINIDWDETLVTDDGDAL